MCPDKDDTPSTYQYSTAPKEEQERRAKLVQEGKAKITSTIRDLSELPSAVLNIVQKHEQQQEEDGTLTNTRKPLILLNKNKVA